MLVKIKKDKQMSATSDCTPSREVGVLAFWADNINAEHDNSHYLCHFTMDRK
tara:strand:- start:49 stop:204 length:156 start_codon:yes stop_codon:yes gene_type:complete